MKGGKKMEEKKKVSVDKVVEKIKKVGDKIRSDMKDSQGVLMKTASASMSVFPKEARKHLLTAHKETVQAGRVMVEDYLKALDNLIQEVSK
jgi:hypothetical protein